VETKFSKRSTLLYAVFFSASLLAVADPASAAGLERVNTFMQNVLTALKGISISVVTIAIMWAGYKFLFKHADISECAKILGGGLLIGGAAELASYILS